MKRRRPSRYRSTETLETRAAAANLIFGVADIPMGGDVPTEPSATEVQWVANEELTSVHETDQKIATLPTQREVDANDVPAFSATDAVESSAPKRGENELTTADEELKEQQFAAASTEAPIVINMGAGMPSQASPQVGAVGGKSATSNDAPIPTTAPRAASPSSSPADSFGADSIDVSANVADVASDVAGGPSESSPADQVGQPTFEKDVNTNTLDVDVKVGCAQGSHGNLDPTDIIVDPSNPATPDAKPTNPNPVVTPPQRIPGDANLDGRFNSEDFVHTFVSGKYNTGKAATWEQGDWDENGVFDSNDIVKAFTDGRYERPAATPNFTVDPANTAVDHHVESVASANNDASTDFETKPGTSLPQPVEDLPTLYRLDDDENVALVQSYAESLGLPLLSELGTIEACQTTEVIKPGIHVLADDPEEMLQFANGSIGTAPRQTISMLPSNSSMSYAQTTLKGQLAVDATTEVVRFEDDELYDKAVILADTVVFDDAILTLDTSVRHLIIVARNIITHGDAKIQWELSQTQADDMPTLSQATPGTDNNPSQTTSGSRHGGNGTDGINGATGNRGYQVEDDSDLRGAPDISLYVETLQVESLGTGSLQTPQVILPEVNVSGQQGGRGQDGQQGGAGGDGAKGTAGVQRYAWIAPVGCKEPAGHGGNGGDGGDGGDGGRGGDGGAGGDVNIYYVEKANDADFDESQLRTGGGIGGPGGEGGSGGSGGQGGDGGDGSWPFCKDRSDDDDFRGNVGGTGAPGNDGARGDRGADGQLTTAKISAADWEEAFTQPYLVDTSLDLATVGGSVILETANITGDADLNLMDYHTGDVQVMDLIELGNDQYLWEIPHTMTAGEFDLAIVRSSDHTASPFQKSIEIQPLLTGVVFEDEYDALPGGTAYVTGFGLRGDEAVVYDGVRIETNADDYCNVDDAAATACSTSTLDDGHDWLRFTIPNRPTDGELFQRDDGLTDHSVQLDQVYPLEDPAELTTRLKRHDGLVFRPTVNGFQFSNSQMTNTARNDLTVSLSSPVRDLTDTYEAFMASYGEAEVNALGGLTNPTVWANFGLWYAWWINPNSATCTGMSVPVMRDFFNGVSDQLSTTMNQALDDVVEHTSHVLSNEFLTSMLFETVADATFGVTHSSIETVADFMATGTDNDGDDAPILVMAPAAEVYFDAITAPFELVYDQIVNLATGLATGDVVNMLQDVSDDFFDMIDAFNGVIDGISSAHSLAPYLVTYDQPTDDTPSRMYVYDSNALAMGLDPEEVDQVFIEVEEENGQMDYRFDSIDPGDGTYTYGTDSGDLLSAQAVDFLTGTGNASLLFSPKGWSLIW